MKEDRHIHTPFFQLSPSFLGLSKTPTIVFPYSFPLEYSHEKKKERERLYTQEQRWLVSLAYY